MAVTEGNVETADGGTLSSYRWVIIAGMVLTTESLVAEIPEAPMMPAGMPDMGMDY